MKKVLAIVGPTASGKTQLSVEVAKKINGEIISADSRQNYKYIPISTSHPSAEDLKAVKHHFIDELNPDEEFNAGEFGKRGREIIETIFSKKKQPIIVGGSGLYVRSLIDGFFIEEIKDKKVREVLYKKLKSKGEDYLYKELKRIDEPSASVMLPQNIRRVIRALEIYYISGKRISDLQKKKVKVDFETLQVGLLQDRKYLYNRINKRVGEMLDAGLIEEIKWLNENGFSYKTHNSLNTVGIKEVFKYFDGEYNYVEMINMIKQNTRRYAKRQMTWFRKDKRINWVDVSENSNVSELTDKVIKISKAASGKF